MEVRIECIEGNERGRVYRFKDRKILIGRSSRCDLILDADLDLGVSGKHCEISLKGKTPTLSDCGSTNGTVLAGKMLTQPAILKDGAIFGLGQRGPVFRFEFDSNEPVTTSERVASSSMPRVEKSEDPVPGDRGWKLLFVLSVLVSVSCGLFLIYWHYLR